MKKNSGCFKKGQKSWNAGLKGAQTGWSKGLTKDTHPGLKIVSEKTSARNRAGNHFRDHNREMKKGKVLSQEYKNKISESMKRARRTYARPWNTGLTTETDVRVAALGRAISKTTTGKPKPFKTRYQGIRRCWYEGQGLKIQMRSRWEERYAQWLDKKGIEWQYESVTFITDSFSYTPDFYLPKKNIFVEIKGYWNVKYTQDKIETIEKHYGVRILFLTASELKDRGLKV